MALLSWGDRGHGDDGHSRDDRPHDKPPESSAERHARILAYTGEDHGTGGQPGSFGCGCLALLILLVIVCIIVDAFIF